MPFSFSFLCKNSLDENVMFPFLPRILPIHDADILQSLGNPYTGVQLHCPSHVQAFTFSLPTAILINKTKTKVKLASKLCEGAGLENVNDIPNLVSQLLLQSMQSPEGILKLRTILGTCKSMIKQDQIFMFSKVTLY